MSPPPPPSEPLPAAVSEGGQDSKPGKASKSKYKNQSMIPVGARASQELVDDFLGKHVLFFVGKSDNENVVVYGTLLSSQRPLLSQIVVAELTRLF